jgi:hypothetical protein
MITQVRYSVVGRSRGRVALCAVCTMHVETRSAGFLVEPQNQGRRLSVVWLKTTGTVFSGLASKPWLRFLGLGLKTGSSGSVI